MKHFLLLLLVFALISSGLPSVDVMKRVNKEVKKTYDIETFTLESVIVSGEVIESLPVVFTQKSLFKIVTNNTLLGYAYVSKAPSKTDQFDYLVLLDKDLIVIKSKVLVYREDYGSEIGSKRWLKQFIGKTENDTLLYGDNIAAISGATISVRFYGLTQ